MYPFLIGEHGAIWNTSFYSTCILKTRNSKTVAKSQSWRNMMVMYEYEYEVRVIMVVLSSDCPVQVQGEFLASSSVDQEPNHDCDRGTTSVQTWML